MQVCRCLKSQEIKRTNCRHDIGRPDTIKKADMLILSVYDGDGQRKKDNQKVLQFQAPWKD